MYNLHSINAFYRKSLKKNYEYLSKIIKVVFLVDPDIFLVVH